MKQQNIDFGRFAVKRAALPMAVTVGMLMLAGCNESETTSSIESEEQAKTASVALSAAFPTTSAEASKALVPADAVLIGFRYCKVPSGETWCYYQEGALGSGKVEVNRDDPTATIKLVPGNYIFEAAAFPTQEELNEIDYTMTGGELVEGDNTIRMSFLRGDWTFQDTSGAAAPVTLGDGTVLDGFKLLSWNDQDTTQPAAVSAGKASLNPSLPAGWQEYTTTMLTSAGEKTGGWTWVINQFQGQTNSSSIMGDDYNVTDGQFEYDWDDAQMVGKRLVVMIGAGDAYEDSYYEEDNGPWGLLPDDTFTDSSGTPFDESQYNSEPVDGVTLNVELAEFVVNSATVNIVSTAGTASKASVEEIGAKQSLQDVIKAAIEEQASGDQASKSSVTEIGTLIDTWYDPVIAATEGDGTDHGSWNFDEYVYDETTGESTLVEDGCLVTDASPVYATCGWLEQVQDPVTGEWAVDPGHFTWGLAPSDPNNLGDYQNCGYPDQGIYDPWCFYNETGDPIDYGSFSFSHYMEVKTEMSEVRVHSVTAGGSELTP